MKDTQSGSATHEQDHTHPSCSYQLTPKANMCSERISSHSSSRQML